MSAPSSKVVRVVALSPVSVKRAEPTNAADANEPFNIRQAAPQIINIPTATLPKDDPSSTDISKIQPTTTTTAPQENDSRPSLTSYNVYSSTAQLVKQVSTMESSKQAQTGQASRDKSQAPPIAGTSAAANTTRPVRLSRPLTSPNTVSAAECEATRSNQEGSRQVSTSQVMDEVESSAYDTAPDLDRRPGERPFEDIQQEASPCVDGTVKLERRFKSHKQCLEEQVSALNEENSRLKDELQNSKESARQYAEVARECYEKLRGLCMSVMDHVEYDETLKRNIQTQLDHIKALRKEIQECDSSESDHQATLRAKDEEIRSLTQTVREQEARIAKLESWSGNLMQMVEERSKASQGGD